MNEKIQQIVNDVKKNNSVFIVNPASSLQENIADILEILNDIKEGEELCPSCTQPDDERLAVLPIERRAQ